MIRTLTLLLALSWLSPASAQWSLSVLASAGEASVKESGSVTDGRGGVLSVGTELAYGFGGRIDRISLRLEHDRYRGFYLSEVFNGYGGGNPSQPEYSVLDAVEGWRAWQLTAGIEGPFLFFRDDSRLRMQFRAGIIRTGGVDAYRYAIALSDGDNTPDTQNIIDEVEFDTDLSRLERYRIVTSYGLAYRITPEIRLSLTVEQPWGNLGVTHEYVIPDGHDPRTEEYTRFYRLASFRLGVAAQLFGDR